MYPGRDAQVVANAHADALVRVHIRGTHRASGGAYGRPRTTAALAYLAVLIDLYSRKVVGWVLDDHMRTELCLDVLQRALAARPPAAGLVQHSDRGSHYASAEYVAALDHA